MVTIEQLINLDYSSFVFTCFVIMSGFVSGYTIIGKVSEIIGKPVKWVRKKNEDHKLLINTINQVSNLEQKDDVIKKDIDEILILLTEHIETDKKNTRATFRSSLYRMHSDFTSRGFITKEGLKTFLECGEAYEKADGDDIYHDKLKPEIMRLPIKELDSEGIIIDDI